MYIYYVLNGLLIFSQALIKIQSAYFIFTTPNWNPLSGQSPRSIYYID